MAIGDIALRSGGTIHCASIRQWRTYEGVLEGLPTRRHNQKQIETLLEDERNRWSPTAQPYLVPPMVRHLAYPNYPFGEPEELPAVTIVAHYVGYRAALTIVWFQDEFAFPIDAEVLKHLDALDFAGRAVTVEVD